MLRERYRQRSDEGCAVYPTRGTGGSHQCTFPIEGHLNGTKYDTVTSTKLTRLANPLPFNIAFWAGPGEESTILKVASAYEAATHHRKAPPAFGPLAGEP